SPRARSRTGIRAEEAYGGTLARLLRGRGGRPRRRSALQHDERAPPDHLVTSAASKCIQGGDEGTNVFSALRVMTNSDVADHWTGRSAGCSPLIIRPA